jgi:hypothetical protein
MDKLIRLLGGYTKDEVLTTAVKELYNTIGADDILKEDGSLQWTIGNRLMAEAEKKQLIAEAQIFLKSKLWKVLQADIKYQANKRMFEKAQTDMDLIAGKLWLYTLNCFKTRLESLDGGRGVFNDDAH